MNFVRELERLSVETMTGHGGQVEWIDGRVEAGDTVQVFYRQVPGGHAFGRTYNLKNYDRQFSPNQSASELAAIAFSDDLADPSGRDEFAALHDALLDEDVYWITS